MQLIEFSWEHLFLIYLFSASLFTRTCFHIAPAFKLLNNKKLCQFHPFAVHPEKPMTTEFLCSFISRMAHLLLKVVFHYSVIHFAVVKLIFNIVNSPFFVLFSLLTYKLDNFFGKRELKLLCYSEVFLLRVKRCQKSLKLDNSLSFEIALTFWISTSSSVYLGTVNVSGFVKNGH